MEWNEDLINQIRADKEKERSEDRDNLLSLTSHSLYGEKIHYALELIQNAEDEKSESITFIFSNDDVTVVNDGKSFDKKDVWRICSVKSGGKKKKIGFFGIGFKSVFNITKSPRIISGEFNFEIEGYVYPKALKSLPESIKEYYKPEKGAIFVLPYYPELSTPAELIENFNLIDEKIPLFLNLKELRFIDKIHNSEWTIKKEPKDNLIVLQNTRIGQETKWRVFSKDLHVDNPKIVPKGKEGIEDTRITIAFPVERDIMDSIKKSGVAYCYLPTKKRTDLSFLIQADFLPTVGRENISEHAWNIWLMEELGSRAAIAIDEIKGDDVFVNSLYEFIPLEEEIQDDIIKHLYRSFRKGIGEKEIAKTTKGWIRSDNCVIPVDDRIRDILTETDLKLLFGEEVFYVIPDASERDKRVLLELGAKQVGIKEVIDFLKKEDSIKTKKNEWFLDVYDYLSSVFDISKRLQWDENTKLLFEEAQNSKFILTDDEKLVSLKDPAKLDRLICYPQSINLSEIHQIFTEEEIIFLNRYFQGSTIAHRKEDENEEKRERVKVWFDSIGVRQYFKQVHVIKDVILPKFITGKYKQYDDLKLYKLTDYIRTYWSTIETEISNKKVSPEIIREIKSAILLKTHCYKNGNKVEEYKKSEDIYFSEKYGKTETMEALFSGIENVHFLSSYYLNREKREVKKKNRGRQKTEYTWRKFFEILGVWNCPRVVKEDSWISIRGKEEYNWIKKEYSPRGSHEIYGNAYSDDIKRLIEYCSKVNEQEEIRKRMVLLWESLEKNWKFYKENKYCVTEYKWFYNREYRKDYESSVFLEFLRNASWIPTEKLAFCKPSELFLDTKKNRLLLGDGRKYVSLKAGEAFLKDLGIRIEPIIEEAIAHLREYRENNTLLQENKSEKMNEIYNFLQEKTSSMENEGDKVNKLKEIKEVFDKSELLYLPREDRVWWRPSDVFWKDFSVNFETLRGYVEHEVIAIYGVSLKDFFFSIGVVDEPLVKECFGALEELKVKGDLEYYKRFASRIYVYIDSLIKRGIKEELDWNKAIFLSENGNFLCPSELYFIDNNEYKEYFGEKIELLWLPFLWINIRHMLQVAGFKRLGKDISVVKKIGSITEVEGDVTRQVTLRLFCVENYLKKKNMELYRELKKEGVFEKIKELQIFETQKIVLDYLLIKDGSEQLVINDIEREAYFSTSENRIYKLVETLLFSTSVAKELSKLFGLGEEEAFPVLDSLFSATDEDELEEKIGYFGIHIEDIFEEEAREEVKLMPQEENQRQDTEEMKKEIEELDSQNEGGEKPQLPSDTTPKPKESDLIDNDDFIFDAIEEHAPYTKADGAPIIPMREIKLKEGVPGSGERNKPSRERATRIDAEGLALEIVMRFEEMEDRLPEDRHAQRKTGYDIFSKTKDNEELFIEVKHFRGESGTWELDHYQWKKAEQEGDRFFVYVVSGLRKGLVPKIQILQNPVKYLVPDPPYKKGFSDWKNGVIKIVKCQKV